MSDNMSTVVLSDEREDLLQLQSRFVQQMEQQNEIQLEKLQEEQKRNELLKEQLRVESESTESRKIRTQELERQNFIEQERIRILEELIHNIQQVMQLVDTLIYQQYPTHNAFIQALGPKIDLLIELMRLIIVPLFPKLLTLLDSQRDSEVQNLLVELLKYSNRSGSVDVNVGTTVKGNAERIQYAQDHGSITESVDKK